MSTGMIWTLWTVVLLAFTAVMILNSPTIGLGAVVVSTPLLFMTGAALITLGAVSLERSAHTL